MAKCLETLPLALAGSDKVVHLFKKVVPVYLGSWRSPRGL